MRICSKNRFFLKGESVCWFLFFVQKRLGHPEWFLKIFRVPFPAASQVCPSSQTNPVLAALMAARNAPDKD